MDSHTKSDGQSETTGSDSLTDSVRICADVGYYSTCVYMHCSKLIIPRFQQ